MKKIANVPAPSMFRKLLSEPAFLGLIGAPLVGAGVNALVDHKRKLDDAKATTIAYREMMDLHPHFKTRDPQEISRIYSSIRNVNPVAARDPLVAGAWIDNIIESKDSLGAGKSHYALLNAWKDLSGIRSSMSQATRAEVGTRPGDQAAKFVEQFGNVASKAKEKGLYDLSKKVDAYIANETSAHKKTMIQQWGNHDAAVEEIRAEEAKLDAREADLARRQQELADRMNPNNGTKSAATELPTGAERMRKAMTKIASSSTTVLGQAFEAFGL